MSYCLECGCWMGEDDLERFLCNECRSGRYVEKQWECGKCGTLNRSSRRYCRDCRARQGESTREHTDWVCDVCNTVNPNDEPECAECLAPRSSTGLG